MMNLDSKTNDESFIQSFRAAAPYIHAFRGKTFVIAFGGEVVASGRIKTLTHDLNLLASLGVKLVLVHGARPQIEAQLNAAGIVSRYAAGRRITDRVTLEKVKQAALQLRCDIEALLSLGLPDSPMRGAEIKVVGGNFVTAKPLGVRFGVDFCYTGEVRKVCVTALEAQLAAGHVVLLSTLGYSPTGEVFNLTLEDVAQTTAIGLQADKLIFLQDSVGILDANGKLQREVSAQAALSALQFSQSNDTVTYVPCCVNACRQGVARSHLISRDVDGALLQELFTHWGIGTMITEDPLENVSPAAIDDVGGILRLIEPLEVQGVLVKRSRERLEQEIAHFAVLKHDERVIGCVAIYPYSEHDMAELACLVVEPSHRNGKRADRLLEFVEAKAKQDNIHHLFVLTTHTAHWFIERGFVLADVAILPPQKQQLYNYQRRSQVFIKYLGDET